MRARAGLGAGARRDRASRAMSGASDAQVYMLKLQPHDESAMRAWISSISDQLRQQAWGARAGGAL